MLRARCGSSVGCEDAELVQYLRVEVAGRENGLDKNVEACLPNPDPWAEPKCRSTLGFYNLHHRSIRIQNWGIYLLVASLLRLEVFKTSARCRGGEVLVSSAATEEQRSQA